MTLVSINLAIIGAIITIIPKDTGELNLALIIGGSIGILICIISYLYIHSISTLDSKGSDVYPTHILKLNIPSLYRIYINLNIMSILQIALSFDVRLSLGLIKSGLYETISVSIIYSIITIWIAHNIAKHGNNYKNEVKGSAIMILAIFLITFIASLMLYSNIFIF